MKQIKNLIRKKVFLYIESNNIILDDLTKENFINYFNVMKKKLIKNKFPNTAVILKEVKSPSDKNYALTTLSNKEQSTTIRTRNISIKKTNDSKLTKESQFKISSKKKVKRVFFKNDIINEKQKNVKSELSDEAKINGVN